MSTPRRAPARDRRIRPQAWAGLAWLVGCGGTLAAWYFFRDHIHWSLALYAAWTTLISLASIGHYFWDKRQARRDGWRIAEARLHLLELLGGWPGALIGQSLFRHKTRKLTYRLVFWLILLLHLGVLAGLAYLSLR